jgi:putative oxidoreductase
LDAQGSGRSSHHGKSALYRAGTQKLFGFPYVHGTSPLFSFMGFAGSLELVGGVLLLVGLGTRIVAVFLSGEMAVAYLMVHVPRSFFPLVDGGEAAILYCFIFLLFVFAGGGSWTIDGIFRLESRRTVNGKSVGNRGQSLPSGPLAGA